jgi:hypothetical protein
MMDSRRTSRIALSLIALGSLPVGVQAAFAPRSFFDDFPFGRGWVAAEGEAFNEHLVRDVGALFLALIVATAWTVWRKGPTTGIALAWLVQGTLHFWYHVGHLDGFDTGDRIALLGSLIAVPALAVVALVADRRPT